MNSPLKMEQSESPALRMWNNRPNEQSDDTVTNKSITSKESKMSKYGKSMHSAGHVSRWKRAPSAYGSSSRLSDISAMNIRKRMESLEVNPTIQEQMLITKDWWSQINVN